LRRKRAHGAGGRDLVPPDHREWLLSVDRSTAGSSGQIAVAGAGYAGLHVVLRLTAKLRNNPKVELTLVDRHDYRQSVRHLRGWDPVAL
jgi:hypothetical protein